MQNSKCQGTTTQPISKIESCKKALKNYLYKWLEECTFSLFNEIIIFSNITKS